MAAGGAAAAAIAQAIKASGAIVRVEPNDFEQLVGRHDDPLIVLTEPSFWDRRYRYLVSYKGFVFFTRSSAPLHLPGRAEIVAAKTVWVPS
jgi:hypothetical protein